jgi:hypothetical protein
VVVTLVIVFLVFRVALHFLLPVVLRKTAAGYDLACTYDRLDLSLLGGDAGIWNLQLAPLVHPVAGSPASSPTTAPAPPTPLIQSEYIRARISPLALLIGRLHVFRLEADGAEILLERQPDGRIPLLDRLVAPAHAPAAVSAKPADIDLGSPLRIDALRIEHLRVQVRDRAVVPNLDIPIGMELRITDLGSRTRPTRFEFNAQSDPLVDHLRIQIEGSSRQRNLDAAVQVDLQGLRPKPVAGYLAAVGLGPDANEVSGRLSLRVHAEPLAAPAPGIRARVTLDDAELTADHRESLGLDHLVLEARSVDRAGADFAGLTVEGLRLHGSRSAAGLLRLAGLCLTPVAAPAPANSKPVAPAVGAPASTHSAYRLSLQEFILRRFVATFDDEAVAPPAHLEFALDELTSRNLTGKPLGPDTTITIAGFGRAPGIARSLKLEGRLTPISDRKALALRLTVAGIRLDALRSYLAAAGLESEYTDGLLTADIDGTFSTVGGPITGEATLKTIRIQDGDRELLNVPAVRLAGLRIVPAPFRPHLDLLEITGPALQARRDPDGTFALLGIHTLAAAAHPQSVPAAATGLSPVPPGPAGNPLAPPTISLPPIEIGRLTWKDVRLTVEDRTTTPPTQVRIADAAFNLHNLVISPDAPNPGKATFDAFLAAPGLADRITLDGSLTPRVNALAADLAVHAVGLNAFPLAPYLRPLGIEPVLRNGSLDAQVATTLRSAPDGLHGSLALRGIQFKDGPAELASLAGLDLTDILWTSQEIALGALVIDRPRAALARDSDHAFRVAGIRILPNAMGSQPVSARSPSPCALLLQSLTVKSAALDLTDRAAPGPVPVHTVASADITLANLTLGRPGPPATLTFTAALTDIADRIALTGSIGTAPDSQSANLTLNISGLRAGPAAAYLPPGITVPLTDGRLTATLDALWTVHPAGGHAGHLTFTAVDFRDGPAAPAAGAAALLHCDRATIALTRVDPAHAPIDIDCLEMAGLTASATHDSSGALQAVGLRIASAPARPSTENPRNQSAEHQYALPLKFPAVHLRSLDLRASALTFRDDARPGMAPVQLRDLRFHNLEPMACLGDQPDSQPPMRLQCTTAVSPVAEWVTADIEINPFSLRSPQVAIDLSINGIAGPGLLALAPQLRDLVDASPLRQGTFHAQLSARARLDRRSPIDFAFTHPFDSELILRDIRFQSEPDGIVLLGLDELRAEGARFDPSAATLDIKTLELTKPIARATLYPDGIHALGLVLKLPSAATQPSAPRATDRAAIAAAAPTTQSDPPGATFAARIDKFTVSGLDVRLEDRATNPVVVVPFTGMELEAYGLSSNLLSDPQPIRYNLLLSAGQVPLASRGAAGPADRELFAEITSTGRLALAPHPNGYVKASVSGFELASLRGLAGQYGVTLTNGLFDEDLEARFRADGTGSLHTRTAITDLSLSEPPTGPIAKFFHFPAPLNAAIAAVQAPDGSITLPIEVPLKDYRFGTDDIVGPAVGAVAQAVAVGIASTPLKFAAGLLGGGSDVQRRLAPVTLTFAPGATVLDASSAAALQALVGQLRDDDRLAVEIRHELAPGDLDRAGLRANPDPAEARSIVDMLRGKRVDLLNLRVQVAGQFRAALAANPDPAANRALYHRLRAIDIEIAQTEEALDLASDLFRPGAALQADRRTRAAALQIARERLDLVVLALTSADLPDLPARMVLATPQLQPADAALAGRIVVNIVRRK